jgi:hypothetical protein
MTLTAIKFWNLDTYISLVHKQILYRFLIIRHFNFSIYIYRNHVYLCTIRATYLKKIKTSYNLGRRKPWTRGDTVACCCCRIQITTIRCSAMSESDNWTPCPHDPYMGRMWTLSWVRIPTRIAQRLTIYPTQKANPSTCTVALILKSIRLLAAATRADDNGVDVAREKDRGMTKDGPLASEDEPYHPKIIQAGLFWLVRL